MVTITRRSKQEADLKHVVDNVIGIEHLDSYLTSISISLIGHLIDARPSVFEEATRSSPTAGEPNITILPREVDRIIGFQHYIRYMKSPTTHSTTSDQPVFSTSSLVPFQHLATQQRRFSHRHVDPSLTVSVIRTSKIVVAPRRQKPWAATSPGFSGGTSVLSLLTRTRKSRPDWMSGSSETAAGVNP